MAIITTPNATQIAEIRSLVGLNLSTDDIGDTTVAGSAYFGGAFNFVFEAVVEGLTSRPADATALSALFQEAVRTTQENQFNRAVMYRTAGLLVSPARILSSEGAGGVSQSFLLQEKSDQQDYLFGIADDEIRRLRGALPNDIFVPKPSVVGMLSTATFFGTQATELAVGAQAPTPGGGTSLPPGWEPWPNTGPNR